MTNTHLLKEPRKFPRHITLLNYQIEGLISVRVAWPIGQWHFGHAMENDLVVNLSRGGGKIYINKPLTTGEHKKNQLSLLGISDTATSMVKIACKAKLV